MKRFRLGLLCLVAAAIAVAGVQDARTADHLDAPDLSPPGGNLMTDIADVFAFPPSDRPNQVVIAVTYNPAAGIFGPAGFDPNADYAVNVDTDGDAVADITFMFDFDEVRSNGRQDYEIWRDGALVAAGSTDRTVRFDGGGGRAYAGLFDDPFFFDLDAFLGSGGRGFCDSGANDFFTGLNVNAVVLQLPAGSLGGGPIGIWATTGNGSQVDRMGFPAINTVFIPSNRKNAYNEADPTDDVADFSRFVRKGFKGGGNNTATARALTGVLMPDVLPYDPDAAPGFLNGRRLADDVIDAELGLLTNGALTGDCVDANDVPFADEFPYLADAH